MLDVCGPLLIDCLRKWSRWWWLPAMKLTAAEVAWERVLARRMARWLICRLTISNRRDGKESLELLTRVHIRFLLLLLLMLPRNARGNASVPLARPCIANAILVRSRKSWPHRATWVSA